MNRLIEDQISIAGDLKTAPESSLPIPKQWLPSWMRTLIQLMLVPFVVLDEKIHYLVFLLFRPPYKIVGKCKKRGNCCYYIRMKKQRGFLDQIQLFWALQVNGFYLRFSHPVKMGDGSFWVMGCRYLKPNGRCGNYLLRPQVCRRWPNYFQYFKPHVLKGCGYKIEERTPPLKVLS